MLVHHRWAVGSSVFCLQVTNFSWPQLAQLVTEFLQCRACLTREHAFPSLSKATWDSHSSSSVQAASSSEGNSSTTIRDPGASTGLGLRRTESSGPAREGKVRQVASSCCKAEACTGHLAPDPTQHLPRVSSMGCEVPEIAS